MGRMVTSSRSRITFTVSGLRAPRDRGWGAGAPPAALSSVRSGDAPAGGSRRVDTRARVVLGARRRGAAFLAAFLVVVVLAIVALARGVDQIVNGRCRAKAATLPRVKRFGVCVGGMPA